MTGKGNACYIVNSDLSMPHVKRTHVLNSRHSLIKGLCFLASVRRGVAATMVKRVKEPAKIPKGIQDMVTDALSMYGGSASTNRQASRPLATPARSDAGPPRVLPEAELASPGPTKATPATPLSTPLKEPLNKRYRSIASLPSTESLPRLPSFGASSSEKPSKSAPRHSDTQSTINTEVMDGMAKLHISGTASSLTIVISP